MLFLSFICGIAGSATAYAQTPLEWRYPPPLMEPTPAPGVRQVRPLMGPTPAPGVSELRGDIVLNVAPTNDSSGNIVSGEATLNARFYSCSPTINLPTITRIEINRPASATNPNVVTYMSVPIDPLQPVKNRTIRIENVRANVATLAAQSIFSNPSGLSVTVFTTPGPPEGTLTGPLVPTPTSAKIPSFLDTPSNCAPVAMIPAYSHLRFPMNSVFLGFNITREDSKPDNFNTYSFDFSFTHNFVRDNTKNSALPHRVGVTADFDMNFRKLNGVDLTKTSVLGGATLRLLPTMNDVVGKANITAHVLFGISHLTSSAGSVSTSDNSFTGKFGGALDVNATPRFFIRAIGIDYAPTHFNGSWQNNVQFTFGAGYRWGHTGSTDVNVPKGP